MLAIATPTAADAACQILFGLANIGTLFNEFRGQADGKIRRQVSSSRRKFPPARPTAAVRAMRSSVARLTQLFLQRRQRSAPFALPMIAGRERPIAGGAEQPLLLNFIGQLVLQLEQPFGAAIWPRSDASCTAVTNHVAAQGQVK